MLAVFSRKTENVQFFMGFVDVCWFWTIAAAWSNPIMIDVGQITKHAQKKRISFGNPEIMEQ